MFPVDPATGTWDSAMLAQFNELAAPHDLPWKLADLLPEALAEEAHKFMEAHTDEL